MKNWLSLITSLPTENATVRMRAWRALKACGTAVLRDGVYLLPDRETCRNSLQLIAADVVAGGGVAYVLRLEQPADSDFVALFDRNSDYGALLADVAKLRDGLSAGNAAEAQKQVRKLRKHYLGIVAIDFFPGAAQKQAEAMLQDLEQQAYRLLHQDEPHALQDAVISQLDRAGFQGRVWATRRRPWVDRLASAWLIRRYIDSQAQLLWLDSPAACPADALGFDFDGARFSHVGSRVTFEVLLASFGLQQAELKRLGALVHYLDVGGVPPPEASGIEAMLAGLRETIDDDNQLQELAGKLFDGLLAVFARENAQS